MGSFVCSDSHYRVLINFIVIYHFKLTANGVLQNFAVSGYLTVYYFRLSITYRIRFEFVVTQKCVDLGLTGSWKTDCVGTSVTRVHWFEELAT